MKILLINKFYYERGGAEIAMYDTKRLLESAGHEVIVFSMANSRNLESPFAGYFAPEIDFSMREGWWKELKKACRSFYSKPAAEQLEKIIIAEKPEIAHLHNFLHHLTPSILTVLKKHKVPVVQTLHDFQMISPAYNLRCYRGVCQPADAWQTLKEKQVQNSYLISLWADIEHWLIKVFNLYQEKIDWFLAPSQFMLKTMEQHGVKNISYLNNPLAIDKYSPQFIPGEKLVCVSRLVYGKGIETLLKAVEELEDIPVQIIGEGEDLLKLKQLVEKNRIRNVEFLGYKNQSEIADYVRHSRLVVFPSELGENSPYVVTQAMAWGKPVIASDLGGVPELVTPRQTGWVFEAGNYLDLRQTIKDVWYDVNQIESVGKQAREKIEKMNEHYVERLQDIYLETINREMPSG